MRSARLTDVDRLYVSLSERGLSARTVRYTHSVLRTALRHSVIARHTRLGRHRVTMERSHYAGLLRPPGLPPAPAPPRCDPAHPASGEVSVRDLAVYAAIAEGGAA